MGEVASRSALRTIIARKGRINGAGLGDPLAMSADVMGWVNADISNQA